MAAACCGELCSLFRGQPADWLKKNDSHYLSDLCYLEMGLGHQSLRMEFENPKASYNLLVRNQSRCDQFLQCLTCKSCGEWGAFVSCPCLGKRLHLAMCWKTLPW